MNIDRLNPRTVSLLMGFLGALASFSACSTDKNEDDKQDVGDSSTTDSSSDDAGSESGVTIRWWGQSCFSIVAADGTTVLNDPSGSTLGYPVPTVQPQVVTVSHDHPDHNQVDGISGTFETFKTVGDHDASGITFKGVLTYHDEQHTVENIVFVWEMNGIHFVHLGDLGHLLTDEQIAQIGAVDVLMVPVGGGPTIDAAKAVQVVKQLSPKLVLPMHYKTDKVTFLTDTADTFLDAAPDDWVVDRPNSPSITVNAEDFSARGTKVVVLDYE
jgi:L-ascorbate metabolism protein UlaG (beta-lactamase superfamily)